jgi:hypothetical protein
MPFVQRDGLGNIVAAQRKQSQDFSEFVEAEALLSHIKTAPALERAVKRATARNSVNLESANTLAFMAALVEADVLTQTRSDTILEP